jgi:hypothetical protein
MRSNGPNGRRPRGRHHGGGGGNGNNGGRNDSAPRDNGGNRPRSASSLRHQSFDSNCIDLRVRGNAWQVHEKYQALARDAQSGGDRVAAENYLQHAEHYFRIIEAINEATAIEQRIRPQNFDQQPNVPNNYYGTDGASAPQPTVNGEPNGNRNTQPHHQPQQHQPDSPQAEATVQQRNPPPSPFFTQEEIEEHNGDQPMIVAR